MVLTDNKIDEIAEDWDLYSIQDNGLVSKEDFRSAVDECVEEFKKQLIDTLN